MTAGGPQTLLALAAGQNATLAFATGTPIKGVVLLDATDMADTRSTSPSAM